MQEKFLNENPKPSGNSIRFDALMNSLLYFNYDELLMGYQETAKTLSQTQTCASCSGVESTKALWAAAQVIQDAGRWKGEGDTLAPTDVAGLPPSLAPAQRVGFGTSGAAMYQTGVARSDKWQRLYDRVREAKWKDWNWKNWLETNKAGQERDYLQRAVGAFLKKPAHAHSVMSRATMSSGIRLALVEFSSFVSWGGHARTEDHERIFRESLALRGQGQNLNLDESLLLIRLYQSFKAKLAKAPYFADSPARTVSAILTCLIQASAEWAADATLAPYLHLLLPGCAALCRAWMLSYGESMASTTLGKQKLHQKTRLRRLLLQADFRPLLTREKKAPSRGIPLQDFEALVDTIRGKSDESAPACAVVHAVGGSWDTERSVEFGTQCGWCELDQGSGDLTGRFMAVAQQSLAGTNPFVGTGYYQFANGNASQPTAWDLQSAVACKVCEIATGRLFDDGTMYGMSEAQIQVMSELREVLSACPAVFVGYVEALLIEASYMSDAAPFITKVIQPMKVKS
ncbi:hypothetical protein [Vitiosangium sp. GDMCC 1.1324]|uniref:hypothetical protein n=1 Tax=Vitiosangium sp. (strain GDMCC 1.1324) TaxID=2138576 RepID=UPI000D3699CF|nr:hypothetical protein [Vitiosangium sp. GDMCC 1.1324]PTL83407.1 hypothetical protein DAT35_15645 [Vitiosangium sp. GDMCC 1.1324]